MHQYAVSLLIAMRICLLQKTFVGTQQAIGQPKMISRLTLGLDEQSPQFHSYFLIVHVYAPSCRRVLTGRGY